MCGSVACAQSVDASSQEANDRAKTAAVDSLASWTAVFQTAAQQWVSKNLTGDTWNISSTTTPNSFGTYPPVLLYAGANSNLCGAPLQVVQTVNLVSAGYLPSNFDAAYSGEYCAVVYPDSGTATVAGPVGSEGGTDRVAATTILAYFVAGATTDGEGLLSNSTGQDVVSHLAPLLGQNFAAGGTTLKYAPTITNGGTSASTWVTVQP